VRSCCGAVGTVLTENHVLDLTTIMDDLIHNICVRAGVNEDAAKQSVGAILNYIKRRYSTNRPGDTADTDTTNGGGGFDIADILTKLEGADELMKQEKAEAAALKASEQGVAGLFGLIWQILKVFGILLLLQKLLAPVFGAEPTAKLIKAAEDGVEIKSILAQFGIEPEQALKVVRLIFDFLKDKLDAETIARITNNIPAIKAILTEEKKEE
jgi:hypothetical protein